MAVCAISPSSSESPSTVYGPLKRLQPVEPVTIPSANVALGATSSQPSTSTPEASTQGVPSSADGSAGLASSSPQAAAAPKTSSAPSGASTSLRGRDPNRPLA